MQNPHCKDIFAQVHWCPRLASQSYAHVASFRVQHFQFVANVTLLVKEASSRTDGEYTAGIGRT
jgi:hypothetical protein